MLMNNLHVIGKPIQMWTMRNDIRFSRRTPNTQQYRTCGNSLKIYHH